MTLRLLYITVVEMTFLNCIHLGVSLCMVLEKSCSDLPSLCERPFVPKLMVVARVVLLFCTVKHERLPVVKVKKLNKLTMFHRVKHKILWYMSNVDSNNTLCPKKDPRHFQL